MSSTDPEVLLGLNQRPERVSIPTFQFLQERTHLRHQTRYSLSLFKTTILLSYKQADQQALDSWTQSKLKRMTLGPSWPLRTLPLRPVILGKKRGGGGGGGGAHPLQPSLQESKSQGLGICLPLQDVWVRSFTFLYILYYVLRTF